MKHFFALVLAIGFVATAQPAWAQARAGYWSTYFIEISDSGEFKHIQSTLSSLAAEWRLESVAPRPQSGVELAFVRGDSVFTHTFFVTADLQSDKVEIRVAVDPLTTSDHDSFHLFRAALERGLSPRFTDRMQSATASRLIEE